MAQAAAITINDGATTPVATTFNPESVTPALSSFADRSSGIALAFRRITVSNSFANGKDVANRARVKVSIPVTTIANGVTSLAYTLRCDLSFVIPDGATDAQRKDLHAFAVNALNHALIKGAVRDLDPLY